MPADPPAAIRIRGARTHNLRGIDVDIPLGKLVVITGISGSGKSSLAFDTLFAEGQRRYLESVSVHTRSLLSQLPRPRVDEISGLPPTVSVDQRVNTVPARSTLAVTTEIYDFLRLLFARAGTAHCTKCGTPVRSQSVGQIVDHVLQLPERSKLMVLSPMVRERRGAHKDVFERIERNGFVRVRVDGEILDVSEVSTLTPTARHSVDAVVDRIILKEGISQRLRESIDLAVRESDGTCIICRQIDGNWEDTLYSTRFSCADCNLSFQTPEPRTFSFNSSWGACPECEGFGVRGIADDSDDITVFRQAACETCGGERLQPFARGVTFAGKTLGEFTAQSVEEAFDCVQSWMVDSTSGDATEETQQESALVATRTLPDVQKRLECLQQVGLGYLTLNRPTRTLSGGEFQRARLAACLGTGLHGACFVLDEPTSGLHPRDTQQLLTTLTTIRDSGATVVLVEHDPEIMRAADHLVDLGPGAGWEGGQLIFSGPANEAHTVDSPTGKCLRNEIAPVSTTTSQQELFENEDQDSAQPHLNIRNARQHNLLNLTVQIPLEKFVCVTGVSGSGKSSLVMDTLLPIANASLDSPERAAIAAADANCDGVDGLDGIDRVVAVDNSPPGRNKRSCIATYSGVWNEVRKIFSRTREARAQGFSARRFSFNSGDGRCSACKGTGEQDIRMPLLPEATIPCAECRGSRFNHSTLKVSFNQKNVAEILCMRVDEAVQFFSEFSSLHKILDTFRRVGLGYLTLGQPASTFSGGESQRVKLATELTSSRAGRTLFILDEPTSGLHPADVAQLLTLLRELVQAGHSVIVVEHNTDVMQEADWLIDIGPDSAAAGGQIVAAGPPEMVASCSESRTAAFLSTGKSSRS